MTERSTGPLAEGSAGPDDDRPPPLFDADGDLIDDHRQPAWPMHRPPEEAVAFPAAPWAIEDSPDFDPMTVSAAAIAEHLDARRAGLLAPPSEERSYAGIAEPVAPVEPEPVEPVEPVEAGEVDDGLTAEPHDDSRLALTDVTIRGRSRERRRRQRARRRLMTARLAAVAAVLAAVLTVVIVIATRDAESDRRAERPVATPTGPPPVLLTLQGPDGRASSLTLLFSRPKGGTLVFIPPGTMAEIASLGLEPVGVSLELGGPERLLATVENIVGVPLDDVQVIDSAGLASLLDRAGELVVRIPERVEDVDEAGTVSVLYEPGPTVIQPSEAAALLSTRSGDGDLARLARHQSFWEAWLDRLRADRSTLPKGPPSMRATLEALIAGDVDYRVLPVEPMGTTAESGELYRVLEDDVRALVAAAVPGIGVAARTRVQVLNGTGGIQVAQRAADRLVEAGLQVKLTGNAPSFGYEQTQVIFYDRAKRAAAEKVRAALGAGRLVLSRRPLTVVDVTVIVGSDAVLDPGSQESELDDETDAR